MKTRAELTAKGEVQRVGYRDAVERIARKLRLVGYVENIRPYDVRIVCEGEKETVKEFIQKINIKFERIYVESIDVKFEKPTDEFTFFEIRRGDLVEELGERFDRANYDLKVMTEKQTETISILKENKEILTGFKDETNDNFTTLNSKYHIISEDMKSLKADIHKFTEAMVTIAKASLKSGGRARKEKRKHGEIK